MKFASLWLLDKPSMFALEILTFQFNLTRREVTLSTNDELHAAVKTWISVLLNMPQKIKFINDSYLTKSFFFLYQKLKSTGDQDICYYNFDCANPRLGIQSFNNFFSNIGYVMLGFLFVIIVAVRFVTTFCLYFCNFFFNIISCTQNKLQEHTGI